MSVSVKSIRTKIYSFKNVDLNPECYLNEIRNDTNFKNAMKNNGLEAKGLPKFKPEPSRRQHTMMVQDYISECQNNKEEPLMMQEVESHPTVENLLITVNQLKDEITSFKERYNKSEDTHQYNLKNLKKQLTSKGTQIKHLQSQLEAVHVRNVLEYFRYYYAQKYENKFKTFKNGPNIRWKH